MGNVHPDRRGVSPVVGKALEISVVVLYIGLLSTTLYGGVVPDFRSAAGDELADRTLAGATQEVEDAVPPGTATAVDVRRRVELPRTIRGEPYHVRTDGRTLVLDHPDPNVAGETTLAVPAAVAQVEGSWSSTAEAFVVVEGTDAGLVVRLERGDAS
ncbi:DUF7266 family protein [Haloarchaeobius iranensis]|uniref:Uncharacterized protein n=1 Tax=Haloarchaeobius iranensis TaxID=996166 RepID=A0A1G9YHR5_9EURY|nr:hypothetical protein [Haloarchaeobius iranensis]SDN08738.1 hypothetical protein SAMN05192554_11490 [Haloarchaeobius iranensis]